MIWTSSRISTRQTVVLPLALCTSVALMSASWAVFSAGETVRFGRSLASWNTGLCTPGLYLEEFG